MKDEAEVLNILGKTASNRTYSRFRGSSTQLRLPVRPRSCYLLHITPKCLMPMLDDGTEYD